ncbi:MAG: hypothetical protein KME64_34325 [Scytonematopsis contorta HA4267-MV1]|nr:hypothetical protein [Scytonematopsis contorta HA4267-MV1]
MRGGKSTTEGLTVQHVPSSQQALPEHSAIQVPERLSQPVASSTSQEDKDEN